MPTAWFNAKFPKLSAPFGTAVLVITDESGKRKVASISEDFVAATLGDKAIPEAPTVFVPIEERFLSYVPINGIYEHQREPVLITRLSRLLLDCSRKCYGSCNTSALSASD